jgi:hypothetical protein
MEATPPEGSLAVVQDLLEALGELDLRLLEDGFDEERRVLQSLLAGYLVPRAAAPDGPLVVAMVGESGSGKSTIVDSLARHRVSPTGARRPTTRRPLVWTAEPLPPTLADLRERDALAVVTTGDGPPEGIVVVDTPPPALEDGFTSPSAAAVLERADVCVLVVSGLRYADAASWGLLERATSRGIPIVVVLNRLAEDPAVQGAVAADLSRRLADAGVAVSPDRAPLITVAEGPIMRTSGGLPPEWVALVRKEIEAMSDLGFRRATIRRGMQAARRRIERGLLRVRDAMVDASLVHGELAAALEESYRIERSALEAELAEGGLAELDAQAASLTTDLAAVVARRANRAARRSAEAWSNRPAGARIVERQPDLWTHGERLFDDVQERFADWDRNLGDLVLDTLGRRRMLPGRLRRYVDAVRRESIDPGYEPAGRLARRRRRRLDDAPFIARRWLIGIGTETVAADADRFRSALGPAPSGDVLRRLVLADGGSR